MKDDVNCFECVKNEVDMFIFLDNAIGSKGYCLECGERIIDENDDLFSQLTNDYGE